MESANNTENSMSCLCVSVIFEERAMYAVPVEDGDPCEIMGEPPNYTSYSLCLESFNDALMTSPVSVEVSDANLAHELVQDFIRI